MLLNVVPTKFVVAGERVHIWNISLSKFWGYIWGSSQNCFQFLHFLNNKISGIIENKEEVTLKENLKLDICSLRTMWSWFELLFIRTTFFFRSVYQWFFLKGFYVYRSCSLVVTFIFLWFFILWFIPAQHLKNIFVNFVYFWVH